MIGLSYEISWTFFNCLRFYGQNGDFFSFINKKKNTTSNTLQVQPCYLFLTNLHFSEFETKSSQPECNGWLKRHISMYPRTGIGGPLH